MKLSGRWKILGRLAVLAAFVAPTQGSTQRKTVPPLTVAEVMGYDPADLPSFEEAMARRPKVAPDVAVADVPQTIDIDMSIENPELAVVEGVQPEDMFPEMAALEPDTEKVAAAMHQSYVEMVAESILSKRRLAFEFIANQESNEYTVMDNGFVRQDPISNPYFCSAGALTWGWGTMIPFEKASAMKGKKDASKDAPEIPQKGGYQVAKEGRALLDILVVLDKDDNNRPLTLEEKQRLALDLREAWISAGRPKDWLHTAYVHPDFQHRGKNMHLFTRYAATPESCWNALCFEAGEKLDKMDGVENTTFIQTMAADSSYRRGFAGLTRSSEYTHLKDNVITEADAGNTPTFQRNRARKLVMELHDLVKSNPFSANDTEERREAQFRFLTVQAIAISVQHYRREIINHNADVPLKVALASHLAVVQLAEDAKGYPLTAEEMKTACQYADNLIYGGFFKLRQNADLTPAMREDAILLTADIAQRQSEAAMAALKKYEPIILPRSIEFPNARSVLPTMTPDWYQGPDPLLSALCTVSNVAIGRLKAVDAVKKGGTGRSAAGSIDMLSEPTYAARSFGVELVPTKEMREETRPVKVTPKSVEAKGKPQRSSKRRGSSR